MSCVEREVQGMNIPLWETSNRSFKCLVVLQSKKKISQT